jgi:putative ATPase
MRGGDADAALYWLGRMIYSGEDPLYVARRMVRFASEDIGLADNNALQIAMQTYQACHVIGMPECDVIMAHCATVTLFLSIHDNSI